MGIGPDHVGNRCLLAYLRCVFGCGICILAFQGGLLCLSFAVEGGFLCPGNVSNNGATTSQIWGHHVDPTPTLLGRGGNTMAQSRTWPKTETHNTAPAYPPSLPAMEGTASALFRKVEEEGRVGEDERGVGDGDHSHW